MSIIKRAQLFTGRKAVSPLIATVLLIAFAVALGAVVMNWGRGYVEDTANIARERSDTEVTCTADVTLAFVEIDNVAQICYNVTTGQPDKNKTMFMIMENKKQKNIEKVQARMIGTATRVPLIVDLGANSNISANSAKMFNFTYDSDIYGAPNQVKVTPYIKVGANEVGCAGNAAIETTLKPCSEIWTN
jgi:flagellin-like protein